MASIETLVEGAPAALNVAFMPVCLWFEPFRTSAPTPTSIGHLVQSREVGIEFSPMWRGSAGAPCCAVTRGRDGQLHGLQII
jgi:hypothetical protein